MKKLVPCTNCGSQISDSALKCPICWKDTVTKDSLPKELGGVVAGTAGTGAILLSGPAGLTAALFSGVFSFAADRKLRKEAKKVGAIDLIYLEDDILLLVTEREFIIVTGIDTPCGPDLYPGFLRSDLHSAYIDEKKSRPGGIILSEKTVLHLDYFDTNYRKKEVREDYKFTGKNSRAMAELALIKFKEYQLPAS